MDGVIVKQTVATTYIEEMIHYSDTELGDLFPDHEESICNKLLRRAQRAEKRVAELGKIANEMLDLLIAEENPGHHTTSTQFRQRIEEALERKQEGDA